MKPRSPLSLVVTAALLMTPTIQSSAETPPKGVVTMEPFAVRGETGPFLDAPQAASTEFITGTELESINAVNIEDTVKYLPNLNIRKRYIGDTNGVTSIRGQHSWMTGRSLVSVDGIPLSNFLQTRWDGSPRWAAVAPDEIQYTQVTYGPYSAFASGNALAGAVQFFTRMPEQPETTLNATVFAQDFNLYGSEDTYAGSKLFASYGDRWGKLSLYLFYNRLENESHPQSFRDTTNLAASDGSEINVTGAWRDRDPQDRDRVVYGSTGSDQLTQHQLKLKTRYAFTDAIEAQFSVVYVRNDSDQTAPENYLRALSGSPVWSGPVAQDGVSFTVNPSHFSVSERQREDVLAGLTLGGDFGEGWSFDSTLSYFDVIQDENRASARNPADPADTGSGTVTWFDNTRWVTFDGKIGTETLGGNERISALFGYSYAHYQLGLNQSATNDWAAGSRDRVSNNTGGQTDTNALAIEFTYRPAPAWRLMLGTRQEWWQASDGYVESASGIAYHPDRDATAFSPKLTLDYQPGTAWKLSLDLAKAKRFPLVPELFQGRVGADGQVDRNNPDLHPEDAFTGEASFIRFLPQGQIRLTYFREEVNDAIFNLLNRDLNYSLFLNIDRVLSQGVELVFDQRRFLSDRLDLRANASFTDSTIQRNSANPDYEGNRFPRIPRWRINLLATWHVTEKLSATLGARHQSHSFNNLENNDFGDNYGSISRFTVFDLKFVYRVNAHTRLGLGIDNLTNEEYFVSHPYPQRTLFAEVNLRF